MVEPRPDEAVIEEICERFLKLGFETELSEFDGRTQAWEAVKRCWHELYAIVNEEGAQGSPVDAPESHSTENNSHEANTGGNVSRKRNIRPGHDGREGNEEAGGDDDEDEKPLRPWAPKKVKSEANSIRLSCPFRKRNPLRFNIRDHPTCATTFFPDMYSLK